jgi:hypothetical protein
MRTTLTLEEDIAEKLQELAAKQRLSFKETVNSVLRRGLSAQEHSAPAVEAFRLEPFRAAFRAGVDPLRLNQLADDLDAEHALDRALATGGA